MTRHLCCLIALTWAAAAGATPPDPRGDAVRFTNIAEQVFPPPVLDTAAPSFDVVAADMDRDGDTDLLFNWHHRNPLELLENRSGVFHRTNHPGDDRSGLFDNPTVPSLYAEAETQLETIRAEGAPGLYVWHDTDRSEGHWRFYWLDPDGAYQGLELRLESSVGIEEWSGVDPSEVTRLDPRRVTVRLGPLFPSRSFTVRTGRISVQLVVTASGGGDAGATPVRVGSTRVLWPTPRVSLWKADPHGIAWVDVQGSREPELFISRGTELGLFHPDADQKVNSFFLGTSQPAPRYRAAAPGTIPPDTGRGRRVEWVDVDHDGRLDMSIVNQATPNALLLRPRGQDTFADEAAALGLDFADGNSVAWADYDGDGYQDLYRVDDGQVLIYQNRRGQRFTRLDGGQTGLVFAPEPPGASTFDWSSIRLADSDADGLLDVWVIGLGAYQRVMLFRRVAGGYEDVSDPTGLAFAPRTRLLVFLDVDNDGFDDAVGFGLATHFWRNLNGLQYTISPLPRSLVLDVISGATTLDVNHDGRTDLVAIGRDRHLLRNDTPPRGNWLDVVLEDDAMEPIGAVVRAFTSDGRIMARRYGSEHNTVFGQGLQPLRFAIPAGVRLEQLRVQWPNTAYERSVAVTPRSRRVVLRR